MPAGVTETTVEAPMFDTIVPPGVANSVVNVATPEGMKLEPVTTMELPYATLLALADSEAVGTVIGCCIQVRFCARYSYHGVS